MNYLAFTHKVFSLIGKIMFKITPVWASTFQNSVAHSPMTTSLIPDRF